MPRTQKKRDFPRSERISARLTDPIVRQRLEQAMGRWEEKTKPVVDAIRASEQLNEKDFAIRINAKG
jgi:hypothetical protein